MAEKWFYRTEGTDQGPVNSKELVALARGGKLQPTDLVWKEGMADRTPAGKVKGLFPTPVAPPPTPTPPQTPAAPPPAPPAGNAAGNPGQKPGLFDKLKAAAQQVHATLQDPKAAQDLIDKATAATKKAAERVQTTAAKTKARLDASSVGDPAKPPPRAGDDEGQPRATLGPPASKKLLVVGGLGCAGLAVVACVLLARLGSTFVPTISSPFTGGGGGAGAGGEYYPEELAAKHEAVYLVSGLYDLSSPQAYAVGVDRKGKTGTVYWRFTTTFSPFDSEALEALIGKDTFDGHNRDFVVKHELNSNRLSGKWSWWHVYSKTDGYRGGFSDKDQVFQNGSFSWEFSPQNRFQPDAPKVTRHDKVQAKERYEDVAQMVADYDAVYVEEPSRLPSPGLKKLAVGVYGKKPRAVLWGQWDGQFEQITDRNCGGLPREDVVGSSVSYELRYAEVKGTLGVTRRVEGFQPKKTDTPFAFKLTDRERYKSN